MSGYYDYNFIISQQKGKDTYGLWEFDPSKPKLLKKVRLAESKSKIGKDFQIAQIGGYVLQWGPVAMDGYYPSFPFRVSAFDPASKEPLGETVQQGAWPQTKFWRGRIDFAQSSGDVQKQFYQDHVQLLPFGTFMLNWIPTAGRGTHQMFNFDPGSADPLPGAVSPQEPWGTIQAGHELVPVGPSYMIDWVPETGDYRLWSVDPAARNPLTWPALASGNWEHMKGVDKHGHAKKQLVVIGSHVLEWTLSNRKYRLFTFDPDSPDPLVGPIQEGHLPDEFTKNTTLTGVQPNLPVREELADLPGTLDFMRSKIKHVVYYMIENRSLDHICGWLYENEVPNHLIGSDRPYDGASEKSFNRNTKGKRVYLNKYLDGKRTDEETVLEFLYQDPYHEQTDVMRQLYYDDVNGYHNCDEPNMGGFVWNNGNDVVMTSYTADQVPVLNGLAKAFAISDEWFCSMPGGTDVNRAFSLTGSSYGMMNNFQNPPDYEMWPEMSHRPSIWKILWGNGVKDWKIYNSTVWFDVVFTDQLFLKGQIPTVDSESSNYVQYIDQFYKDAASGNLPKFTYIEPIWCADTGSTSYHPGGDLVPGERALNDIYNALRQSPCWEETLFVITFDEHGGVFDHVPPPYTVNPYPNDENDGFRFDVMGVRVPTILVSPWIKDKTVFRAEGDVPYDSTSILATILHWMGIPRDQWGLGRRTHEAPTFEGVLQEKKPRKKSPDFEPPYDKHYPKDGSTNVDQALHDLHRTMTAGHIWQSLKGKVPEADIAAMVNQVLMNSHTVSDLGRQLAALKQKVGG